MFREPVGRQHVRVFLSARLVCNRVVRVLFEVLVLLARGIRALGVERVVERRFVRFVVRRQRSVLETLRHVEPALAVRLHDERVVAADGLRAFRVVGRNVVRRLLLVEVGRVVPRPLLLLRVPPHEPLALGPRLPVGIRGRTVVQQPTVRRPRPGPFEGSRTLLPVRLLAGRLVLLVAEDTGVDPAAARRRPVRAEKLVARQRLPCGIAPADLLVGRLQHHVRGKRLRGQRRGRRLPRPQRLHVCLDCLRARPTHRGNHGSQVIRRQASGVRLTTIAACVAARIASWSHTPVRCLVQMTSLN